MVATYKALIKVDVLGEIRMLKISIDLKSLMIGILLMIPVFFLIGAVNPADKVAEYKINSFIEIENLEAWVNNEISKGWEPLGGVSISYIKYSNNQWGFHHSQAMVKK